MIQPHPAAHDFTPSAQPKTHRPPRLSHRNQLLRSQRRTPCTSASSEARTPASWPVSAPRQLAPQTDISVIVADRYSNYSICGIPYHIAGDVPKWQDLAHRTRSELETAGLTLHLDTHATDIDAAAHTVTVNAPEQSQRTVHYDRLVVATGASPAVNGIAGLSGPEALGPEDGVHQVHSIDQMHELDTALAARNPRNAVIIGAGYIGLEMAEALTRRGLDVALLQRSSEVLSTFDPSLASLIHAELTHHRVHVQTSTTVRRIRRGKNGLILMAKSPTGPHEIRTDLVLAATGVHPNTRLLTSAGASLGPGAAIAVDHQMRTGLPDIYAAGDCVTTRHRLLGETWLPLGTTTRKQGRIAGENAVGGDATFAGILGTQVVKVFDLVAARTGLREA